MLKEFTKVVDEFIKFCINPDAYYPARWDELLSEIDTITGDAGIGEKFRIKVPQWLRERVNLPPGLGPVLGEIGSGGPDRRNPEEIETLYELETFISRLSGFQTVYPSGPHSAFDFKKHCEECRDEYIKAHQTALLAEHNQATNQPGQGEGKGIETSTKIGQAIKLRLEVEARETYWEGNKQETLSRYPYKMLYALAKRPNKTLTYGTLGNILTIATKEKKAISRHIQTIIARISPLRGYIENTPEVGYSLKLTETEVEINGNIQEVDKILE